MSSIYIHIPFCEHKCIYCDFYSIAPSRSKEEHRSSIDKFLTALETEIQLRADEKRYNESVETIFFGGGTPSLLLPSEIEKILKLLSTHFSIEEKAEITLETNPGTVDKDKLKAFRTIGVNRLSIGVQSFFDDDLKFLTRIHTVSEAKQYIEDSFKAGFENISIDMIFSLPNQTLERWKSNLEQAVELSPSHISAYSLILEPETPLFGMVKSNRVKLLDSEKDAELYEFTMEFLTSHGYKQYEISNFAKPNYQCRHNLNYWNHSNYLGFGPSAHSFWINERWWNVSDLNTYINLLEESRIPISGGEHLTQEQIIEESIYLSLRSYGINLKDFKQKFGIDFLQKYQATTSSLLYSGKALIKNGYLRLTPKGYVVCDEICQLF